MVNEYLPLLDIVVSKLSKIGFHLRDDSDFIAVFGNNSVWSVVFEGERYVRPAFDLRIVRYISPLPVESFSVKILMIAFENHKRPSLLNQLVFLAENLSELLINGPVPYEEVYKKLDYIDMGGAA